MKKNIIKKRQVLCPVPRTDCNSFLIEDVWFLSSCVQVAIRVKHPLCLLDATHTPHRQVRKAGTKCRTSIVWKARERFFRTAFSKQLPSVLISFWSKVHDRGSENGQKKWMLRT
ncbi:hypothetical protein BaRGS_00019194 [Batillaria attramentaria]|uniref:Uncharacterized protein n=1 Tax=Batillaria attramentaria TaxID=370345 RepID=A0ABD0KR06_9CAEN